MESERRPRPGPETDDQIIPALGITGRQLDDMLAEETCIKRTGDDGQMIRYYRMPILSRGRGAPDMSDLAEKSRRTPEQEAADLEFNRRLLDGTAKIREEFGGPFDNDDPDSMPA